MSDPTPPSSVLVYPLADAAEVTAARSRIEQAVRRVVGTSTVSVNPHSGALRIERAAGRPGSGRDLVRAAERILADLTEALSGAALPALLPDDLRPIGVGPVSDFDSTTVTAWNIWFRAYLHPGVTPVGHQHGDPPSDEPPSLDPIPGPASPRMPTSEPAPVVGGTVLLRLSTAAELLSLASEWRPLRPGAQRLTALWEPPAAGSHGHGTTEPDKRKTMLAYSLASQDDPQRYLAPVYLVPGHMGLSALPASDHSLAAVIEPTADDEVRAVVVGHAMPTRLRYAWGAWSISEPERGLFNLGDDERATLPPGCHNVILDVLDTATEAVCRTESVLNVFPTTGG